MTADEGPGTSTDTQDSDEDRPNRYERVRARIARNKTLDLAYRAVVTIVGFGIIAGGILLLPLPGPGWLIIFIGLGLLATEYEWSRRLLEFAREQVGRWVDWVQRQPLVIRLLIGLGCLALVCGAIVGYIWWAGVPDWLPDWVPVVDSLPTRD